jgi:hypothetical protein
MDDLYISTSTPDAFSPDRLARTFHQPGSVRLPNRWKPRGKVSRDYERREEYGLRKVSLVTLGGCLAFQSAPPQIVGALQVDRIRLQKERTKTWLGELTRSNTGVYSRVFWVTAYDNFLFYDPHLIHSKATRCWSCHSHSGCWACTGTTRLLVRSPNELFIIYPISARGSHNGLFPHSLEVLRLDS